MLTIRRLIAFLPISHHPRKTRKLAETLIDLYGKDFRPDVINKFRNGDIRDCYGDISKIQALGFQPRVSIKEGLKDLVAWGEKQKSVSRVEDAHRELVEKGLVV